MKKLTLLLSVLFLTAGQVAVADTGFSSWGQQQQLEIEQLEQQGNNVSPAQTVAACAAIGIAGSPANVWNNGKNCASAIKDLCSWSPRRGMRASGGASVSQCMVFLSFLR